MAAPSTVFSHRWGRASSVAGAGQRGVVAVLMRWLLLSVGVVLGGASAAVEFVYLLGAGAVIVVTFVVPPVRRLCARGVRAGGCALVRVERWRLAFCFGEPMQMDHVGRGVMPYLTARSVIGLVSVSVGVAGVFWGVVFASLLVLGWDMVGPHSGGFEWPMVIDYRGVITPATVVMVGSGGLVLLYVTARCTLAFAVLERRLVEWFLRPDTTEALERRIVELTTSRAEVVQAVNQERRRIERDLHDGVQQRLVALAMLLGRARRRGSSQAGNALVRQAHVEAQEILNELRAVAWSVYPSVLDVLGLDAALAALAERSSVPVRVACDLAARPPAAVEAGVYFVVSEAVNNAVKHANADRITVQVHERDGLLVVDVRDDGIGGADPAGSGLVGLARRVEALDGRLAINSPAGGPTEVIAELPCG